MARVGRRVLAACPRAWDCAGFAGGAFLAPERPPPWRGRGLSRLPGAELRVPRLGTAPRLETPGTASLLSVSSTRPWLLHPLLAAFASESLDIRGRWPHDGVLKRALGRYCASLIFT